MPISDESLSLAYSLYGGAAEYFLNHPELGPILQQATAEGWDVARLTGAVSQTGWWQTSQASSRAWDALQATDPATAQAQVGQRAQQIRIQAARLGVQISPSRVNELADLSLRLSWDDGQLTNALAGEARFVEGTNPVGSLGASVDDLRGMAKDYGVAVSDRWAYETSLKIVRGEMDANGVRDYLRGMAKSRFTHLADVLDKGMTVREYAEPYVQRYAQLMEMNPADLDIVNDPKLSRILDHVDDAGARRSMSLSEMDDYVRSTDEWHRTDNAKTQYADMAQGLLKFLGKAS